MSDQIKQIAMRVKELREIFGVSLESLAEEFKLPLSLCEQYESGNTDIPVSYLVALANKFNIELTALLTGEEPKLHIYSLVRKGKGVSVERRKEYGYQSLAYNFSNKKAEPFLVTVQPNGDSVHLNSHPGQEFNYILEGTLKIVIDKHELILHEGDSLYFDSGYKHGMQALNGKPARFLAVIIGS